VVSLDCELTTKKGKKLMILGYFLSKIRKILLFKQNLTRKILLVPKSCCIFAAEKDFNG